MAKKQSVVYVIDDDESVGKAFARLVRSAGFTAETFSSADEFLSSPRQKENGCIIIDMRVLASKGSDFQRKLKRRGMRLPVIVVSVSDDEQSLKRARQLGAVSFFRKPVDDQALLDAISWVLSAALS
jgi:FixJ family two-component response regulator